ncbi:MAG: flavin reductase family protein [Lachnospiraceae bacterium]|jgi:flavin reductase (DIM6/NTAB) family NADH-FMN oxidoreductase RutF|nr:flavin reductase family protein [Lachnospiraceae bacterium]
MEIKKREFKPGNLLYPVPAVLVSVADGEGNANLFTVAWTGTVCTNPPMLSISVRPERYSYHMLRETGEFVVNLTTESMAFATDFCGVRSGRDTDKWKETGLTKGKAKKVLAPIVQESPVSLECRVTEVKELGSHHLFLAEIIAVSVSEAYLDANDTFRLSGARPLAYSHGRYYGLGDCLGSFGYSVRKTPEKKAKAGRRGKNHDKQQKSEKR